MKSKIGYLAIIIIVAFSAFAAGKIDRTKNKTSYEVNPAYKDAGINYTLDKMETQTANFRNAYPGEVESHLFNKEMIQKILDQPGCYGIRIYNTINDKGKRDIIVVGTDEALDKIIKLPNGEQALFGGGGGPCPPYPPGTHSCP